MLQKRFQKYLRTYSVAQINAIWDAVFTMCDLFGEIAIQVSEKLYFSYDSIEADNSKEYLKHIRALSPDADTIY